DGNGEAVGLERGPMRNRIDAPRQPADDDNARAGQAGGDEVSQGQAVAGGAAGSDHGHGRRRPAGEQLRIAADPELSWRRRDGAQPLGESRGSVFEAQIGHTGRLPPARADLRNSDYTRSSAER